MKRKNNATVTVKVSADEWSAKVVRAPPGAIWLITRGEKLWGAEFEPRWPVLTQRLLAKHGVSMEPGIARGANRGVLARAIDALGKYFGGELLAPRDVELELEGSPIQTKVWSQVNKITPGKTISYKQLARRARFAGAFRAIGAANGANRCAIFVPCHRVVSTAGTLQGYGGGIERKSWLLNHEGVRNDGWQLTPDDGGGADGLRTD